MDNIKQTLNLFDYDDLFLNISFNNLNYKDLLSLNNSFYNDFIDNSLILSSYESLYNNPIINDVYSYQTNFLSFIGKKNNINNIMPLTYNIKYKDGVLGINSNNIIDVSIDNYTVKDSVNLIKEYTIPINILDSYSYIINSYNYKNGANTYSYEVEYSYSFQTSYEITYDNTYNLNIEEKYLSYDLNSYSYYILSYDLNNDIFDLSYNIKYTSSYTYLSNNLKDNFIYVDENNLDKANYDIGLFKSDKDSMKISDDLLSINKKYTDLIYINKINEYNDIYKTLNKRYKELLVESSLFNTYAFNYQPIEDLCLLFSNNEEIIYFDKNQKINNLKYIDYIQIDNDIEEFNLCIPFEYSYKSYIGEIEPIDLSKILINILNKRTKTADNQDFRIILSNDDFDYNINIDNYFNYNNILNSGFQRLYNNGDNYNFNNDMFTLEDEDLIDPIISYYYNINYYRLNEFYSINNYIKLNIDKSYLVDKRIDKYENGKYYGSARYVFNFKINKENHENDESMFLINNFDVIMTIKDSILGDCNIINSNYKLSFSFYIVEKNNLYHNETQTYDVLYHDYNVGFNFDKQGEMIGLCFASQNLNNNNRKPIFCKYNRYNDFIKIPKKTIENCDNLTNVNDNQLNIVTISNQSILLGPNGPGVQDNIIIVNNSSISETVVTDKISNISFEYLKKGITIIGTNANNRLKNNIEIDTNNFKLRINSNNNYINSIFDNKYDQNRYNILTKYFKEIYNLSSSGLRNGDYYIPTFCEYYLMSLYNILYLYDFDNHYILISSIFNKGNSIMAGFNGLEGSPLKIGCIHYGIHESDDPSKYGIIPIFKLPDYSIIKDESYNITFDKDLNHECVVITTYSVGYFSLNIKQYYDNNNNNWFIEELTKSINNENGENIYLRFDRENKKIIVSYTYDTNKIKNKIFMFNIGFKDSDDSFNTDTIKGNKCRILCRVVVKIKS